MKWLWRGVLTLVALGIVAFGGAVAYQLFVAMPQAQARAEAFARLSGAERRLAIYDAFTDAIDKNYYDQSFSGFDWPQMKRDWRVKAAAAPDDTRLYTDVFFQMAQAFPVSHVAAMLPQAKSPPSTAAASSTAEPAAFNPSDMGMEIATIRRGKATATVVGEVLPGSVAARSGVQPGAGVLQYQMSWKDGAGHIRLEQLCLTPAESLDLETGRRHTFPPERACQTGTELRQQTIDYDFTGTGPAPDVVVRRLPSGALYIRFDAFQDAEIDKVIAALKTTDERGAVLDLRHNTGGYELRILQALIGGNQPVFRKQDARGQHVIKTKAETSPYTGPLAVLIGPGSASAAEVTAATLQARHRATLIGRPTNGSVLGAAMIRLPDGGTVEVPVEDVETLEGKRLEGAGVVPDIVVYPTVAQLQAGEDPALSRAEAVLQSQ